MAVRERFNLPALHWAPVIVWMGFIFYWSGRTGDSLPSLFKFQDIAFHLVAYAVLGWFFARAVYLTRPAIIFRNNEKRTGAVFIKIICLTVVFGLLYGFSDEYHQTFVRGRTADLFDIFIDSIGSFLGGLVTRWLK